jgi:hypothetical protein
VLTFHVEQPELVVHICAGYQVALGIKVHPVRATALIYHLSELKHMLS